MNKRFGFTLAEVLITLGIIGVVAAMTIPTLMNNAQDNEFHTAAKKAFSVFANATQKMTYENSGIGWDNSGSDATVNSKNMADAYAQYFSVIKEDFIENLHPLDWYTYKSSTHNSSNSNGTRWGLLLKDGMVLKFWGAQNCTTVLPNGTLPYCGGIWVDTNGNKPPNMWGRDTYVFWVVKNSGGGYKITPSGPDTDGYKCIAGTTDTTESFGCTEYVINNQPLPQ